MKHNFTEANIPRLANIKEGEKFTLYIGRENIHLKLKHSKWSNPFPTGKKESKRLLVLAKFDHYIRSWRQFFLRRSLHELADQTLGCYCFSSIKNQGRPCHGHILINLFIQKYILK